MQVVVECDQERAADQSEILAELDAVGGTHGGILALPIEVSGESGWDERGIEPVTTMAAPLNLTAISALGIPRSEALALLMFSGEEIPQRQDPVAPAPRSDPAHIKDATKLGTGGEPVHSFATLLTHLGTLTRNTVVFTQGIQIEQLSVPTTLQRRVFELIGSPIPTTTAVK